MPSNPSRRTIFGGFAAGLIGFLTRSKAEAVAPVPPVKPEPGELVCSTHGTTLSWNYTSSRPFVLSISTSGSACGEVQANGDNRAEPGGVTMPNPPASNEQNG